MQWMQMTSMGVPHRWQGIVVAATNASSETRGKPSSSSLSSSSSEDGSHLENFAGDSVEVRYQRFLAGSQWAPSDSTSAFSSGATKR